MLKGSTFTYLHGDHLGSTVLETDTSGTMSADQKYRAYGRQRDTGAVVTDHKFTGQQVDATGLMYYQSRYYDPEIGAFISPDTLVPDASVLIDYNRYAYSRANPLKYSDPTGHCSTLDSGAPNIEGDGECWGLAYSIYGYGLTEQELFNQDWKVSPDDWLRNVASSSFATTEYLTPIFERYSGHFDGRTGLRTGTPNHSSTPPTSDFIDGVALGAGFGASYFIFSGGGGIELVVSFKTGEIALVTYYGPGISGGAGANVKTYFAVLNNMSQPEDYAGPTRSIEGTVSTPFGGIVGSRFWSTTPGGTSGFSVGNAPGARISGSYSWTDYTLPWVKYDLNSNQVSFPQIQQIVNMYSGKE